MIEVKAFSQGLGAFALAVRQPLDPATIKLYHGVLDGLSKSDMTREWGMYVAWCLKTGEWAEWFPKLEELRDSFSRWRIENTPALPGKVGMCETCSDTRFEYYQRDGREWVKPCSVCRPAVVVQP